MQNVSSNHNHLSTELVILEALINEQNGSSDQSIIPINGISIIMDYVKAAETVLLLFDLENPGWAHKKLLSADQTWKLESVFSIENSSLCNAIAQDITWMEYDAEAGEESDVICRDQIQFGSLILASTCEENKSGRNYFINLPSTLTTEKFKFLQLIVKGRHVPSGGRTKPSINYRNADLGATYWQILNSRNTPAPF
jgi:hypothetical protein